MKARLVRMRTFSSTLLTATAVIAIGWGLSLRSAQADYLVTLEQQGPNVVATGSGTINLAGVSFLGTVLGNVGGSLTPNGGSVFVGSGTEDMYTGFSGPTDFGPGNNIFSDSDSGSSVGIFGLADILYVPSGYTSTLYCRRARPRITTRPSAASA